MKNQGKIDILHCLVVIFVLTLALQVPAWAVTDQKSLPPQDPAETSTEIPVSTTQMPDTDVGEPIVEKQLSLVEQWEQRYEKLAEGIRIGKASGEDADALYEELNAALFALRKQLDEAIRQWVPKSKTGENEPDGKTPLRPPEPASQKTGAPEAESLDPEEQAPVKSAEPQQASPAPQASIVDKTGSPEPESPKPPAPTSAKPVEPERADAIPIAEIESAEALHYTLVHLYDIRIKILNHVTPELRGRITGTGVGGVRELGGELDYIRLHFVFNVRSARYKAARMLRDLIRAPLPLIGSIVVLVLAVILFRWWRKWAKEGIPRIRSRLLDEQGRNRYRITISRFLWYVDRARTPIEWLVLLGFFFATANVREFQIVGDIIWTTIQWLLFAWLAVRLIDAFAARNTGFKTKNAHLRLRSIWLVTTWLLILGLGLSITNELAGKATLYAWIWMVFKIFALPIAVILIFWWRPEIFQMMEENHSMPPWLKNLMEQRKGLKSLVCATVGAFYLCVDRFRLWVLKGIATFEGGRLLIANLAQLEAGRTSQNCSLTDCGAPIGNDLRTILHMGKGMLVESVAETELDLLVDQVAGSHGGGMVVVAEHGGGKTTLFKRLKAKSELPVLLIDCPPGGLDALEDAFCTALQIQGPHLSAELLDQKLEEHKIRSVVIDNLHRLSRPVLGGQKDIDRFAEMIRAIRTNVLWIFGVGRAAWQYISRVRANKMFLDTSIELNLWSEKQISELVEIRCAEAGVRPDFSQLVMSHQFDDMEYDTREERNRHGFYRILWNASDGNPVVAMRLWADSLRVSPESDTVVCFPALPSTKELEKINMTGLLVLRVITQSGLASQEEIIDSLRFPEEEVAGALRLAKSRGWIEEIDGRYRLTWQWFRSVTRVLSRQNLLVRKTLGDTI